MKTKTIIGLNLSILLSFSQLFSQCIVDAGANRNLCQDEIQSGAKLYGKVLSGNIVDLKWESSFYEPTLDKYYYASIMLSDTTILEPTIEQHFERTVKYYLKGITSTNETCVDSVELNFSDWTFLTVDKITGKSPTDTIKLWIAAQSNWPHTKYEWSPNYMISDTTLENPKVWNDTTVFYNLKITDSLGCLVTDDIFEVYVTPSSTNHLDLNNLKIFPNPASNIVTIEFDKQIEKVNLFDMNAKLIKEVNVNQIDLSDMINGIYFLQIKILNGELINSKIYKRDTP